MPSETAKGSALSAANRRTWMDPAVVGEYAGLVRLFKAEEAILSQLGDSLRGKRILDLGVGAGRTCGYLTAISSDYTGLDYSEAMVRQCRKRFPGLKFLCGDAGNLSMFSDAWFDFVLFAWNGIACVGHDHRLRILKEVQRVLKPGGWFAFSSPNRSWTGFGKTSPPRPAYAPNPLRRAYRLVQFLASKRLRNYRRNRRLLVQTDEYAIVNEDAHDYGLLHYYITIDRQIEQLRRVAFAGPVRVFDFQGNEITENQTDRWVYYLVGK